MGILRACTVDLEGKEEERERERERERGERERKENSLPPHGRGTWFRRLLPRSRTGKRLVAVINMGIIGDPLSPFIVTLHFLHLLRRSPRPLRCPQAHFRPRVLNNDHVGSNERERESRSRRRFSNSWRARVTSVAYRPQCRLLSITRLLVIALVHVSRRVSRVNGSCRRDRGCGVSKESVDRKDAAAIACSIFQSFRNIRLARRVRTALRTIPDPRIG